MSTYNQFHIFTVITYKIQRVADYNYIKSITLHSFRFYGKMILQALSRAKLRGDLYRKMTFERDRCDQN